MTNRKVKKEVETYFFFVYTKERTHGGYQKPLEYVFLKRGGR